MNKKLTFIFLISTLLISFMINTSKVYAAQELTCIYKTNNSYFTVNSSDPHMSWGVMLIQTSDGSKKVLTTAKVFAETNGGTTTPWILYTEKNAGSININDLDDNNNKETIEELTECPNGLYPYNNYNEDLGGAEFTFTSGKNITECNESQSIKYILEESEDYDLLSKINGKCPTEKMTFHYGSFDQKKFIIGEPEKVKVDDEGNIFDFSADEYIKFVEQEGCPIAMYYRKDVDAKFHWNYKNYGEASELSKSTEERPNVENEKVEVNSCSDLFDDDLRKDINSVMNILKIAVPLLIIGLGIVDFSKAVFLNDESKMKEEQKKFIKRLVAGIIFFFIPIFVNLLLTLANKVWKNINPDTCIGEEVE